MRTNYRSALIFLSAVCAGCGTDNHSAIAAGGAAQGEGGGNESGGTSNVSSGGAGGDTAGGAGKSGGKKSGVGGAPLFTPEPNAKCAYTDDQSFCACMGWNCGGTSINDSSGSLHSVYCGSCAGAEYCESTPEFGVGVGSCGGSNPLVYAWQRQKIDMLVAMAENDNVRVNYDYAEDIHDGRGYTIGKVGFCSGTGDFIVVARCYDSLKPGNVLAKYWGHPDASGQSPDGLVHENDLFFGTHQNQGDTTLIDSLAAGSSFVADCASAAADAEYRQCQDTLADADYLATALQHASERGLKGALTIGFLYDSELNLGDEDDSPTVLGAKSIMAKADADYGAGMPSDFTDKPWEESRWLGFVIKERAILMAGNRSWKKANDQNATWEAARRLHTALSNDPENATDLGMDYDIASQYKASASSAGTPCWPSGLSTAFDSGYTVYTVSTDKTASATDQTKWQAKGVGDSGADQVYAACPSNPTP